MKKILLLASLFSSVFAHSKADLITLHFENTPLIEIIQSLETQTNYSFVYSNKVIDVQQAHSINVQQVQLATALEDLFRQSPIAYKILEEHIVLHTKEVPPNTTTKTPPPIQTLEKVVFSGYVYDFASGESLIGCTLVTQDQVYAITNDYGFFSLRLNQGEHQITVSFVGYEDHVLNLNLTNNQQQNIFLKSKEMQLSEVVVSSNATQKSAVRSIESTLNISQQTLQKSTAFMGTPDLTRSLLTQPGITTVGEGTSGFNVRGGNLDQNLILLDEAPFFNSFHLWGFFSNINTAVIKDFKMYKGGIPARFGGRISSVLDIKLKDGNKKSFQAEGSISPIVSHLTLETPLVKDRSSILVSGRTSNFNPFLHLFGRSQNDGADPFTSNLALGFYDVSLKADYRINKNNTLYVSGYLGGDRIYLNPQGDDIINGIKPYVDFGWHQNTSSLRWNHLYSESLFSNISLIYSAYDYSFKQSETASGGPVPITGDIIWSADIKNYEGKADFSYYLNTNNTFRFGANIKHYDFLPGDFKNQTQKQNSFSLPKEKALEGALYAEWEKHSGPWNVNLGVRSSYFSTLETGNEKDFLNWEPRVAVNYQLSENAALKANYQRMFQYIHLISNSTSVLPFDIWKPSGQYVNPISSQQWGIGGAFDFSGDNKTFNFSTDVFYKTMNSFLEYKNAASLFLNKNLNDELIPANGYAYGIENNLYYTQDQLQFQLNYTYSRSQRKSNSPNPLDNINNGEYFSSNFDRPHIFNFNGEYQISKRVALNSAFTVQSGRWVSVPTNAFSLDGKVLFNYPKRNNYRMRTYHRLDVSVTLYGKEKPNKRWKKHWVIGCYNLYARKNPFSIFPAAKYEDNGSKITPLTYEFSLLASVIPYFSYNFKF